MHLEKLLEKFDRLIGRKIDALKEMVDLEAAYNRTLIKSELERMRDQLKQFEGSFDKFKNLAVKCSLVNLSFDDQLKDISRAHGNVHSDGGSSSYEMANSGRFPVNTEDRRNSIASSQFSQGMDIDSNAGKRTNIRRN